MLQQSVVDFINMRPLCSDLKNRSSTTKTDKFLGVFLEFHIFILNRATHALLIAASRTSSPPASMAFSMRILHHVKLMRTQHARSYKAWHFEGLALWKSTYYRDNCSHITNRSNANFTFVIIEGQSGEEAKRQSFFQGNSAKAELQHGNPRLRQCYHAW
jgi:hypothetical protein